MVQGGVELYEVRHDATVREVLADTSPVKSGFLGLHAKAMVVDRQRAMIGSMNLDPRSWVHNTEMALIIDCAPLAEQLARVVEQNLAPENAWRIAVDFKQMGKDEVLYLAKKLPQGGKLLEIRGLAGVFVDDEISAGIRAVARGLPPEPRPVAVVRRTVRVFAPLD